MRPDGDIREKKLARNFLVCLPFCQSLQNLGFPFGKFDLSGRLFFMIDTGM